MIEPAWIKDYPWIDFNFDFSRLDYRIWMALGECGSICTHIGQIPLPPSEWRDMHQVYLAKGVLGTTAIEGNTLSEEEVRKAVQGRLQLPESRAYLQREVDNIIGVFNEIGRQIRAEHYPPITPQTICDYNAKVLAGLALPEEVRPGELREHRVGVGTYRCPPRDYLEEMVQLLCDRLTGFDADGGLDPVVGAILKAIVAHLYIAWIHPFGDGNGRTARLLEAVILLQSGVPSTAAHLLSNHYNATRTEYYRILDQSSRARDPNAFIAYAIIGLRDGLREQRSKLMNMVRAVVWRDHVYRTYEQMKQTATVLRQRKLALELAKHDRPVKLYDIMTVTPQVALLYRNSRSMATLRRDVVALEQVGMIRRANPGSSPQIYVTNMDSQLSAMLPIKARTKKAMSAKASEK